MDWRGYKVQKRLEKGAALCSQSMDRRNNGLTQAWKSSKSLNNPFTFYTKICYN